MKLSDAAVVGLTITELKRGDRDHCFLGAAANAVGIPSRLCVKAAYRHELIEKYWPWLGSKAGVGYGWMEHWQYIGTYFDSGLGTPEDTRLRFEYLVEYVRKHEPACGECNQFECKCVKPAAVQPAAEGELVEA